MDAIIVDQLAKSFEDTVAVDRISFSVPEGELFGLLGPNGAGKTTTINMLATLLRPTSGKGLVAGFDILRQKDDVRRSIGVVFQETALDSKLTGRENLEFHAMMYSIGNEERRRKIGEVMDLVDLSEKRDVLVENYSGGMKRRLEIARGLIHEPRVLFLDEPTLGLDAQTRRYIWDYIHRLNKERGVTIILTTHYMEEADFLCDRVAIIDNGRISACETPGQLKNILGGDVVSLEMEGDPENLMKRLAEKSWIKTRTRHNSCLSLTMEMGERHIPQIIRMAEEAGVTVTCVNLHKPSLEDVFLHYTGRRIRDQQPNQSEKNRSMMRGHMRRRK